MYGDVNKKALDGKYIVYFCRRNACLFLFMIANSYGIEFVSCENDRGKHCYVGTGYFCYFFVNFEDLLSYT